MSLCRDAPGSRRARWWRSLPLLLAAALGAAEVGLAAERPIRFRVLSVEQGLSQSSVLCILQDRDGFIWLGTEDGLNRYDGYSFVHYGGDPATESALGNDHVLGMVEDARGDLWIATSGGGLSRWDRATDSFTTHVHDSEREASLASNLLRTIAIDGEGMLWLGTRDAGLDRFDPVSGEARHFRHDPADPGSLADDHVYAVWVERSGAVWVGTDGGLERLDPTTGKFTHFVNAEGDPGSLSDDRVRSLFRDRLGRLWVGTYGGGLNRLDEDSRRFVHYRHDPADDSSLSHDRVRTVFEDRAGRLWAGTVEGLDLLVAESGRFVRYERDPADPDSLSSDDVTCLYQDRSGVLWVGTQAGGVNTWNPATWSFGHHTESPSDPGGLSHRNVTSIAQDRAGRLWIGTFGGGLNVLDRATGSVDRYRHVPGKRNSISSDRVMALLHDREGVAWIGTLGDGLNRLDPKSGQVTVFRHDPDDPSTVAADGIMSLHEGRDGTLWVGTFGGGLSRLDRGSGAFSTLSVDPTDLTSLSSPRITCIAERPDGQLWIGTDGGGLNLLDPKTGKARRFVSDAGDHDSLSTDTVFALHFDASGRLWIGTQGEGLELLDGLPEGEGRPRFSHFTEREGLADDVVYGILEDASGALWLSTNRGLSRFHPQSGTFRNFDRSHGLQADEFNFGAHYRSADGELFFGGVNGFNAFYPGALERNENVPPVVLTTLLTFDRPFVTTTPLYALDRIDLGYRDDVVTFEFAALDFAAPERNAYRYLLEGFGTDWIELGDHRRITFTDLDGGSYTLRVQAANNDGLWNEEGLALAIVVAPPPWRTWWAYLAYVLMAAAAVAGYRESHQRKLRQEEEYSERLELEVKERTGELTQRNRELEVLNIKLVEASLTDSLTGLRNRRFLFEEVAKDIALIRRRYVEQAMGLPRRDVFDVVFLMIDVDNFKNINDTFGHPAGDMVLVQLRDVLLAACRESDIVIRWGGDEFLVVGRDTDPDRAEALAERIRISIEEHVFELEESRVLRTTVSIGFACYPFVRKEPDLATWEQVLSLADEALYAAKHTARNAWVGYFSTSNTADMSELMRAVREHPRRLALEGRIEIRSSISPSKWTIHDSGGAHAPI